MARKSVSVDIDPRGEATRARLIKAAQREFSTHGFGGVTTRQLSSAAKVNIAAIAYHFGSKKGLYLAAVSQMVDDMKQLFGSMPQDLAGNLPDLTSNPESLGRMIDMVLRRFLQTVLGNPEMKMRIGLIMREYADPSDTFPIMYKALVGPMHKGITRLVALSLEKPPEDPECILRTHAMMGQCMGYLIAKAVICERMGWEDYTPDHIDQIADAISKNTRAALGLQEAANSEGESS